MTKIDPEAGAFQISTLNTHGLRDGETLCVFDRNTFRVRVLDPHTIELRPLRWWTRLWLWIRSLIAALNAGREGT